MFFFCRKQESHLGRYVKSINFIFKEPKDTNNHFCRVSGCADRDER